MMYSVLKYNVLCERTLYMKECKKCLKMQPINCFVEFIAVTKKGKEKRRRSICYDCNYKHRKMTGYRWKTATDKEKLQNLEKRFNKMVIKKEGCWDWNGFVRPDGYARIYFDGNNRSMGAHVASWMIKNKRIIKKGECILHECDNRKCTSPKHLYLGTHKDNALDMVNRERGPSIKLNFNKVKRIKKLLELNITIAEIAKIYDVNWATIYDIREGKTWKHVT